MQTTDFALFHPCLMGVLEVKLKVSTPAGPPQGTPTMRSTFIKTVACTDGYHGGMSHEIRHLVDADFLRSSGYDMDRVEAAVPEVLSVKGKGMEGSECLGMCGPLHLQYRLFENAPAPAWWVDARAATSSPSAAAAAPSSSTSSSTTTTTDSAASATSPSEPPPAEPGIRRISTIVDITLGHVLVVQSLPVPLFISLRGLAAPCASSGSSGGGGSGGSGGNASVSGAATVGRPLAASPGAAPVAFPPVEPSAALSVTAEDLERDRLLCRILNAQLNSHEGLRKELVPESYRVCGVVSWCCFFPPSVFCSARFPLVPLHVCVSPSLSLSLSFSLGWGCPVPLAARPTPHLCPSPHAPALFSLLTRPPHTHSPSLSLSLSLSLPPSLSLFPLLPSCPPVPPLPRAMPTGAPLPTPATPSTSAPPRLRAQRCRSAAPTCWQRRANSSSAAMAAPSPTSSITSITSSTHTRTRRGRGRGRLTASS